MEAILGAALFGMLATALAGAWLYGEESQVIVGNRARALYSSDEGLEAARNIRDSGWSNLTAGEHGLATTTNQWNLSGTSSSIDIFNQHLSIALVDTKRKTVTSTVTWQQNMLRSGTVDLVTRLTNWRARGGGGGGGMLVFGNGGVATDTIRYRTIDSSGTWSALATTADVDTGSTNKALRAVRIYVNPIRNEKIIISRHYASVGTSQTIYAQVYNGDTSSWGNVNTLSSWSASTYLDVQNFDGFYLQNGDFVAVYSDNSTIPKMKVWNGSTWSAQVSMQNIGGIPNYIVANVRPGTSEAMVVFFDAQRDTNSEYYDGAGYTTADWTLHTEHSATAPVVTKRMVDFAWNGSDTTKGLLVFSNNANDRSTRYKVWIADGSGAGSWTTADNGANQGGSGTRLGVLRALGQPNATNFLDCSQNTIPQVICYRHDTLNIHTNPANQIVAATTDAGIQKAFDFAYELANASYAIVVYSDATSIPKLKLYNLSTNAFDVSAMSIGALTGSLKTVRTISKPFSDDIMILLGDAGNMMYSIVWDGTNHTTYATPAGYNLINHGSLGSAVEDYWYDFAWDLL